MASKRVDRFMKGLARILRKTKDNKPVSINLLPLEARLNPAPNLLVPSTSAAAPIGFVGGTLNFSGALQLDLLDTPTPASTSPFSVTVTAGTARVDSTNLLNVTVSNNNSASLTVSGPLDEVNAALATLAYTNATPGAAELVITASDSSSLTDSKTIYLQASSAATAPFAQTVIPTQYYVVETNATPAARTAIKFRVNDPQGSAGILVTASSDNQAVVRNADLTIGSSYPEYNLTLKTLTNAIGTANISITISDGTNFITSSFKVITQTAAAPVMVEAPIVIGTVASGAVLSVGAGSLAAAPILSSLAYQWEVSSDGITWANATGTGAATVDCTVAAADAAKKHRVKITATNTSGSTVGHGHTGAGVTGFPNVRVRAPVRGKFSDVASHYATDASDLGGVHVG